MPSYSESKLGNSIRSGFPKKPKFVDDRNLTFVKKFVNQFEEDLESETNNGDNQVASCGVLIKGNFTIASFDSVNILGCTVHSKNMAIKALASIALLSGGRDSYFYMRAEGDITLVSKLGFSLSEYGIGNATSTLSIPKTGEIIILNHQPLQIYSAQPQEFRAGSVEFLSPGHVTIYDGSLSAIHGVSPDWLDY